MIQLDVGLSEPLRSQLLESIARFKTTMIEAMTTNQAMAAMGGNTNAMGEVFKLYFDIIETGIKGLRLLSLGFDDRFIDAMPTALIKPFSGSGARAMMVDAMQAHGADSFAGRLASIVQGSTETTFYVLAVYFGAVGIKNIRHAVGCGIAADVAGILAAITVAYWFFG